MSGGRLRGRPSDQTQGNLTALQGFLKALRFGVPAPPKPVLNLKPRTASMGEVIVSYIVSDGVDPGVAALQRYQVAGIVRDPYTGDPLEGVEVAVGGSRVKRTDTHAHANFSHFPHVGMH